jgi:hypothetical protein
MDLCSGDCGRIYHGETDCTVTLDEASNIYMKNIKADCTCPGCKISFSRDGGCNHMSCQICKTNFCYLCKNEFPKNEHGKYMITEHFSDNIIGQQYNSRCSQYGNNMGESDNGN